MWLEELDRRLRPHLPPPLAAHAQLANVERGRLVFVVDAPVWRTKLRFAAPGILDAARSIGLDAVELVVKTTLGPATLPEQKRRTQPPISEAAQRELRAALASLEAPVPSGSDDAA
ncbi:MAG: DUF721 domain-containing protein [Pseudomonas sp.]|nr:DUF721 domain-containing protein [Pseudomonas sp.]